MGRDLATQVRRVVPAPVATLHGILSDTNRFDRLTGVSSTRYTYELLDPGDPTSRTRIGHARFGGVFPLHFAEEGEYWAGTFLHGERRYRGGLAFWLRKAYLDVRCAPSGDDATTVDMRVGMEPTWLGWLIAPFLLIQVAIVVRLYLRSVDRLARATASAPRPQASEPPGIHARYALAAHFEPRANGPRSAPRSRLAECLERFASAPVPDAIRTNVVSLVRGAADEDVVQIHPLEVAARWRTDGRETIRTFLHATRAGVFDLEWQVDCPTCRVGTEVVPRLDAIRGRLHCDECDVSFDVDFAAHVHACFTVNPAVRPVPRVVYCATSPFFRPHVHGYVLVAPGQTREIGPLPDGDILVRARGSGRSLTVSRTRGGVAVEVDDARFTPLSESIADRALRVTNRSRFPVRLQVERAGWESPRARGSLIMTIPGFVDLFGVDAPAAGLPLEVGRLALLFTDLVGSVELYYRLGDASAFALIHEHWRDASAIVAARSGAIVKSLGDGLFAAFTDLGAAARAALDIMDAAERLARDRKLPFAIRAGCYEGPCFIVRANDRVDLFGSTVNLAARLSIVAGGQQLALLAPSDELQRGLEAAGCELETASARLKGLPGESVVTLATRGPAIRHTGDLPPLVRRRTDPAGVPQVPKPQPD